MDKNNGWPSLKYQDWKDTCGTLHLWIQIVGKLRFCKTPWINHSWHSTLFVSSRGITTTAIPDGERNFTVEFDFINHQLIFMTSDGDGASFALQNESVSAFFERFQNCLNKLKIKAHFSPRPNETVDDTPFILDSTHCTYVKEHAHQYFQVIVRINNIMNFFRSSFIGKSSPVHLFWGGFDLAVTRFSGRNAPEHPAGYPHIPDLVVKEAYSQEVSSCGFWPGNEMFPHAAFYAYAYPEPPGYNKALIEPFEAYYNEILKEFILPYDVVAASNDPEKIMMSFFESTYRAAADLGNWDKSVLEENQFIKLLKKQRLIDEAIINR